MRHQDQLQVAEALQKDVLAGCAHATYVLGHIACICGLKNAPVATDCLCLRGIEPAARVDCSCAECLGWEGVHVP